MTPRWQELALYAADLDHRLPVREVGNAPHDLSAVHGQACLQLLQRIVGHVADRAAKGRGLTRRNTTQASVNLNPAQAQTGQSRQDHRNMLVQAVFQVEGARFGLGYRTATRIILGLLRQSGWMKPTSFRLCVIR